SRPHLPAQARRGALRATAPDRLMPSRRVTDFLLFAAVFTMSFEKLFWNVAGKIALTEVISILFVGAYLLRRLGRRDGSLPRTSGIVLAFFAAFLLVYLIGFYNLETTQGLTPDPNHLGIQLVVPLLVLGPLYLRLERKHRLRVPLALLIAGLLAVELATLSRSGLLGLGAGFLVLLIPYRRLLISRAMLVP